MKWFEPSLPKDIQPQPWLSPEATGFLSTLLRPEWKVLEHGGGGSTLWFAGLVSQVTCLETDPAWYQEIARRELPSVDLKLWKKRNKLPALKGPFDLMLVDGDPLEDRILFLESATKLVKPRGWVVLDNYNRPEYLQARLAILKRADRVQRIHSGMGYFLNVEFIRFKIAQGEQP